MSAPPNPRDPFREARETDGILRCPFQGESIPMILRHADLRAAARDWQTYSSDAPFRVPIPSEEEVRSIRQVPLEADPPEHTAYRKIIEPFFLRSKSPEVVAKVEALISEFLTAALSRDSIEAVYDFALPIQSRALTYLLNVPESEADTYIGWGIHVFTDAESHSKDGPTLEDYHHSMFDRAAANPGSDFFSALTQATYRGRPLSREEMMGFANLTFAGGRDTIIHSITTTLAHLAQHPADLAFLREDPKRITLASEEFFRAYMPLTHLGRVCPVETKVHGTTVPPAGRVSLGWASANFDASVFDNPDEIRLDRKPNPHISFGFGTHLCLGAPHARLILRSLLKALTDHVASIDILHAEEHLEHTPAYQRTNGYDSLTLSFVGR